MFLVLLWILCLLGSTFPHGNGVQLCGFQHSLWCTIITLGERWYAQTCVGWNVKHTVILRICVLKWMTRPSNKIVSLMRVKTRIYHELKVVFVCLNITLSRSHHYKNLSEGLEHTKYLSGIFCWVWVWDQINYLNHMLCYMRSYTFSAYPSNCDECKDMCTMQNYHHEIGNMNQYLLFRVKPVLS